MTGTALEERFDVAVHAVARAIYIREHPHTRPDVFELVDEQTREWYHRLARPEVEAAFEAFTS